MCENYIHSSKLDSLHTPPHKTTLTPTPRYEKLFDFNPLESSTVEMEGAGMIEVVLGKFFFFYPTIYILYISYILTILFFYIS